ncbi:UDP-N-acetylglucosamine--LPS N-acetylglucosamine transferase [Oceanobacter antarcticus]|uniref:UDP-N-acetylglucosamine--LPS N-acetylglucosamine transferase n=1 Tax=Oceanobacter antarcticus TaxID=3133425 RepID=A0ABW8NEY6_9GAMM
MSDKKILAVSSSGGHWIQLQRLRFDLLDKHQTSYMGTAIGMQDLVEGKPFFVVQDCNINEPLNTLRCFFQVLSVVRKVRPDFIVSTGAAPGLLTLLAGKLTGAKTIWIDSLANTKKLSVSGKLAGYFVDLWLTQWPELGASGNGKKGPEYKGQLI